MKILHTVEFYHPSMGGAQEVVRRISEGLVKKGHRVTVATTKLPERTKLEHNGVQIVEFQASGKAAYGLKGEIKRYQNFVLKNDFDAMMNYAAQQWTFDALIPILDKITMPKVFVPCGFSGLYSKKFKEYFTLMPKWLAQYDKLIFLSDNYRDINFTRENRLTNFVVIPNGASQEEFENNTIDFRGKYNIPKESFVLLTVGGHTGLKGHTLAIRAFTQSKIKNARLVIIGNTPLGNGCKYSCLFLQKIYNLNPKNIINNKKIILLNPPREDVVAGYKSANLFVFGSNIESSPLVLFEAMAAKIPFLTTAAGNAEEIINWSKGGILVEGKKRTDGFVDGSVVDMVAKIELLYNDARLRLQLGQTGFMAWEKKFTFEHIISLYEKLYISLMK